MNLNIFKFLKFFNFWCQFIKNSKKIFAIFLNNFPKWSRPNPDQGPRWSRNRCQRGNWGPKTRFRPQIDHWGTHSGFKFFPFQKFQIFLRKFSESFSAQRSNDGSERSERTADRLRKTVLCRQKSTRMSDRSLTSEKI